MADRAGLSLVESGDPNGPTLVLLPTLGTDHTLWEAILPHLPQSLRILRPDLPGHGISTNLTPPGRIGAYIPTVEHTLDARNLRNIALLGHGLGGLIAQGLATKRLDLVRSLILSGTAARIGTRDRWLATARDAREAPGRLAAMLAQRWSLPRAPAIQRAHIEDMIGAQNPEGIARAAEAMAGTDFYTTTAALRLPALALVGDRDAATPSDLVSETAALIPGSQISLLRNAGHLAMIDAPGAYATALRGFLKNTGHL